jgi:molybdopterin-synthase adenylyltransferase
VDFEVGRYARHRLVDWFDQDQITSTRALVVGAGAIGNEVLKNLALLGVQHLDVIDFDQIEVHNLTRSVLFREHDVGRSKAAVAAERVRELLPEAQVRVMEGPLEKKLRPSRLAQYDVVFSCLDNFEARLALDEMCQLAKVNLVSGAIDARHSSVELYPYRSSSRCACYCCNLPSGAFQRIAQRYSCGGLRNIGLVERKVPTTIVTSALAASMMVSWGLRLGTVQNGQEAEAKRVFQDSTTGAAGITVLERNNDCSSCGQLQPHVDLLRWGKRLRLQPELRAYSLGARLPTEVVFSATCSDCAFDASDTIPPGSRVRGHTTSARICPSCNAEAVAIDSRDVAMLGEIAALRDGAAPEVPYVLVDIGKRTICLEVNDE